MPLCLVIHTTVEAIIIVVNRTIPKPLNLKGFLVLSVTLNGNSAVQMILHCTAVTLFICEYCYDRAVYFYKEINAVSCYSSRASV